MSDAASVMKERKDLVWNLGMYAFTILLLALGAYFGIRFIRDGISFKDSLQIMTLALAIPGFVFLAATNKIPSETVGALISALVGFALGKVV